MEATVPASTRAFLLLAVWFACLPIFQSMFTKTRLRPPPPCSVAADATICLGAMRAERDGLPERWKSDAAVALSQNGYEHTNRCSGSGSSGNPLPSRAFSTAGVFYRSVWHPRSLRGRPTCAFWIGLNLPHSPVHASRRQRCSRHSVLPANALSNQFGSQDLGLGQSAFWVTPRRAFLHCPAPFG